MSEMGEGEMIEFKTVERFVEDGKFVMRIKYVDGKLVAASEVFIRGNFEHPMKQPHPFDLID